MNSLEAGIYPYLNFRPNSRFIVKISRGRTRTDTIIKQVTTTPPPPLNIFKLETRRFLLSISSESQTWTYTSSWKQGDVIHHISYSNVLCLKHSSPFRTSKLELDSEAAPSCIRITKKHIKMIIWNK